MVKAIWEFTHKWFLAAKDTKRKAQKPSKGFIYVFVLKLTHHYYYANKKCRLSFKPALFIL
jgi:hypothetical protein